MNQRKLLYAISFILAAHIVTSGHALFGAGWFWQGTEQTELEPETEEGLRAENAKLREENAKLRRQLRACKNRGEDREFGIN